jgi:hypothetical protein
MAFFFLFFCFFLIDFSAVSPHFCYRIALFKQTKFSIVYLLTNNNSGAKQERSCLTFRTKQAFQSLLAAPGSTCVVARHSRGTIKPPDSDEIIRNQAGSDNSPFRVPIRSRGTRAQPQDDRGGFFHPPNVLLPVNYTFIPVSGGITFP